MQTSLKILMLEDNAGDAEIIERRLKKDIPVLKLKLAMNKKDYLSALEEFKPDLILADNSLPQFNATEALELFHERALDIPFILVTGTVSEEFAVGIMKLGADDYILKDRLARLPSAIESALKQRQAEREKRETWMKLVQTNRQLRELSGHLQNIREEERTRIAREIHDQLGQQLTVMKMDISWLTEKTEEGSDEVKERLQGLDLLMNDTVKIVRKIASELRPALLDDMGLIIAVQWHLKEFKERSGIRTLLDCSIEEPSLPNSVKTDLFRIVQESLTNVARHAKARQVVISFQNVNDNLIVIIKDDGAGFNQQEINAKKTLGLLGMRERTYMIGGTYDINGIPGNGTTVTVTVPMIQTEIEK